MKGSTVRSIMVASVCIAFWLGLRGYAEAEQITLRQGLNGYMGTMDTSLYQDRPTNSNGGGTHLFAGTNAQNAARHALIKFNLEGMIPAGSTIEQVSLVLTVDRAQGGATVTTQTLHRLLADWGEGSVDAGEPGGLGAEAFAGDATWLQAFHMQISWTLNGGDFSATGTDTLSPDTVGQTASFTSTAMAADVQEWLDGGAENFGWVIHGDETAIQSARRYTSSEALSTASPTLTIDYILPQNAADPNWTHYR